MRDGARPSVERARVLIAEDEFLVCEMIADMVDDLGYQVAGQAMALPALRDALAEGGFDCVLLDIQLGPDLTIENADVLFERGVPFAFVTGYPEPAEPRHAAVPVLYKPFTVDQLRMTLDRLIGPAPVEVPAMPCKQAG